MERPGTYEVAGCQKFGVIWPQAEDFKFSRTDKLPVRSSSVFAENVDCLSRSQLLEIRSPCFRGITQQPDPDLFNRNLLFKCDKFYTISNSSRNVVLVIIVKVNSINAQSGN